MLFSLSLLPLLLPIAVLALPANVVEYSDQHGENATGDTLGITRCYCASKTFPAEDYFGYYYLWDYYNFHTNSTFLLERTCYSRSWTSVGFFLSDKNELMCLRRKDGERECMKDGAGNKFCYYLRGKERWDYFTWNHQTRGIPLDSPVAVHEPEAVWMKRCDNLCQTKVGHGDMQLLKGGALAYAAHMTPLNDKFNNIDNEWSHISYYPEVDDMCHRCK